MSVWTLWLFSFWFTDTLLHRSEKKNKKHLHMSLTWEEVSFEAFLGDGVVWLELDPHVVVLWGDDLWDLSATVFTMELRVRWEAASYFDIIVFTHLNTQILVRLLQHASKRGLPCLATYKRASQTHGRAHLVTLQLKGLKLHGDAILSWSDHLPHTVLVGWIFFGPARSANSPIQLRQETPTCRCKQIRNRF